MHHNMPTAQYYLAAPGAGVATAVLLANTTSQTAPGEYTFVQPKRGCCDTRRTVMAVHAREGHVTHHVTTRTDCCVPCQDRFLRESDVGSIVSVHTHAPSQPCRIVRIVFGLLLFVTLFGNGVWFLVAAQSDAAVASTGAETALRTLAYQTYYQPHTYYEPSGYSHYYGMRATWAVPSGSTMVAVGCLAFGIAVAAWCACCNQLHQLTVVLKGSQSHHNTMTILLPQQQVAELAAVIKATKAAHHHTRLGADLDAVTAAVDSATAHLRNYHHHRGLVPPPIPAPHRGGNANANTTEAVIGYQLQDPVAAPYHPLRHQ
jgi:hypothetical protein